MPPTLPSLPWVGSAGGPLILSSLSAAKGWQGVIDDEQDYTQACTVADNRLSILALRNHRYLVLGDAPDITTLRHIHGRLALVRWTYCSSRIQAEQIFQAIAFDSAPSDGLLFEVPVEPLLLFDAAMDGPWALAEQWQPTSEANESESLQLQVPPGRYLIGSTEIEGPGYAFTVHPFYDT